MVVVVGMVVVVVGRRCEGVLVVVVALEGLVVVTLEWVMVALMVVGRLIITCRK